MSFTRNKKNMNQERDPVLPQLTTSKSIEYWQLLTSELDSTGGVYKEHNRVIRFWASLSDETKARIVRELEMLKNVVEWSEYGLLVKYGVMRTSDDVSSVVDVTHCLNRIACLEKEELACNVLLFERLCLPE